MSGEYIFYLILSSVFSGIIGVIISNIYYKKQQSKRLKIDLLSDLAGYRYQLTSKYAGSQNEVCSCLNRIFVIYNKSTRVLDALIIYKSSIKADDFITLLKRMCDDVKLDYTKFNDSLIDEPFLGRKL